MKRRSLLRGLAAAAAASMVSRRASAGLLSGLLGRVIPLTREDHRVVIIGSGFGGGVSALRLAEAGVPVTVLERGLWWPTGPNANTFPSVTNLTIDQRALGTARRIRWASTPTH